RVDKNQVLRLANCEFIKRKENIIITGSTGIGKSFLASALGHQCYFRREFALVRKMGSVEPQK
ncbi:MAG: ATP-binding protein, partial [Bacteroidetes bacterium]|nr:ATP-binding protein [Bacteroidota bacterium]